MKISKLPKDFLDLLRTVKSKRPRTVIEHIVKKGFITTEELESKYGYKHAPRAARDVREQGIPLETFRVKNSGGRSIAAYRFADPSKVIAGKLGGRKIFSKEFKDALIKIAGPKCSICLAQYEDRYLQVDHIECPMKSLATSWILIKTRKNTCCYVDPVIERSHGLARTVKMVK